MVSAYRRLACDPRVTGAVPRNPKGCVAIRVAGRGRRHHALAGLLHGHECRWQAIARDCPAPSWNPALQLRLLRGKAVRPWTRSRPCTPARRRSTPTCATRTRTRTAPSWPRQFGFEVVRVLRVCERLFVSVSGTSPVSHIAAFLGQLLWAGGPSSTCGRLDADIQRPARHNAKWNHFDRLPLPPSPLNYKFGTLQNMTKIGTSKCSSPNLMFM